MDNRSFLSKTLRRLCLQFTYQSYQEIQKSCTLELPTKTTNRVKIIIYKSKGTPNSSWYTSFSYIRHNNEKLLLSVMYLDQTTLALISTKGTAVGCPTSQGWTAECTPLANNASREGRPSEVHYERTALSYSAGPYFQQTQTEIGRNPHLEHKMFKQENASLDKS